MVSVPAPDAGVRLAGVGLAALAAWLLRFGGEEDGASAGTDQVHGGMSAGGLSVARGGEGVAWVATGGLMRV